MSQLETRQEETLFLVDGAVDLPEIFPDDSDDRLEALFIKTGQYRVGLFPDKNINTPGFLGHDEVTSFFPVYDLSINSPC
jgi:hypothetical protein